MTEFEKAISHRNERISDLQSQISNMRIELRCYKQAAQETINKLVSDNANLRHSIIKIKNEKWAPIERYYTNAEKKAAHLEKAINEAMIFLLAFLKDANSTVRNGPCIRAIERLALALQNAENKL